MSTEKCKECKWYDTENSVCKALPPIIDFKSGQKYPKIRNPDKEFCSFFKRKR